VAMAQHRIMMSPRTACQRGSCSKGGQHKRRPTGLHSAAASPPCTFAVVREELDVGGRPVRGHAEAVPGFTLARQVARPGQRGRLHARVHHMAPRTRALRPHVLRK